MKKKKGFYLKNICGSNVIIAEGIENLNFNKMINLNDSATLLWTEISDKFFTYEDLVTILLKHYDVSKEKAYKDIVSLCEEWLKLGIIE